jgi:hypothetical protein
MLKVYNSDSIVAERKEKTKNVVARIFEGGKDQNLQGTNGPSRRFESEKSHVELMAEMEELRHKIVVENAAQPPSQTDLDAFFGKLFVDTTRRAIESPDLTSLIADEQVNFEFGEIVPLRDVSKFRGMMGTIAGTGDAVPLIEQNGGNTDSITLSIKAIGWKDSFKNMLYNKFFTMDKVVQAAIDSDTDARNAATVGLIVGSTFVATQSQDAIATAGLTLDEKTYETMMAGVKLIRGLKDIQTKRKINAPTLSVLCNSADSWQIQNVIMGQLNGNGADSRAANRPALPIANLVEYDRGINDGFTIGKETASFPGVTAGTCYIFVPGVLTVATKRPLTMETGRGSVLELSTEARAWYRIQGVFSKVFLGSSYPSTSVGAGFGYIVKVTLPS